MRIPLAPLALLTLLAVSAGPAMADAVHLKDGTVHEGKILSVTKECVVIETEELGPLPIQSGDIARIERDRGPMPEEDAPEKGADHETRSKPGAKQPVKPAADPGGKVDGGESDGGDSGEVDP